MRVKEKVAQVSWLEISLMCLGMEPVRRKKTTQARGRLASPVSGIAPRHCLMLELISFSISPTQPYTTRGKVNMMAEAETEAERKAGVSFKLFEVMAVGKSGVSFKIFRGHGSRKGRGISQKFEVMAIGAPCSRRLESTLPTFAIASCQGRGARIRDVKSVARRTCWTLKSWVSKRVVSTRLREARSSK